MHVEFCVQIQIMVIKALLENHQYVSNKDYPVGYLALTLNVTSLAT